MLSGAAPLPRHIEEFMRVTGCSVLAQGYGETVRIAVKILHIIITVAFLYP
jgi:long-subunit acyl-CoA synthetase (AMP-forming)